MLPIRPICDAKQSWHYGYHTSAHNAFAGKPACLIRINQNLRGHMMAQGAELPKH